MNDGDVFSYDDLVKALEDKGIEASANHTGGGCATIYIGKLKSADSYYPLAIGPGNFAGRDHSPVGYWSECYLGPDGDDEIFIEYTGEKTIQALADYVETLTKIRVDEDELFAMGLLLDGAENVKENWSDAMTLYWPFEFSAKELHTKLAIWYERTHKHSIRNDDAMADL